MISAEWRIFFFWNLTLWGLTEQIKFVSFLKVLKKTVTINSMTKQIRVFPALTSTVNLTNNTHTFVIYFIFRIK